jgi:hypothetical protein
LAAATALPCHAATSAPVIPADPGLDPGESRNPVTKTVRAFTPATDYWVPARASPVEPGSLGRGDIPYAIPCLSGGEVLRSLLHGRVYMRMGSYVRGCLRAATRAMLRSLLEEP